MDEEPKINQEGKKRNSKVGRRIFHPTGQPKLTHKIKIEGLEDAMYACGYPSIYMEIIRSPLPWNNGNLYFPFLGGNYLIVLLDYIY